MIYIILMPIITRLHGWGGFKLCRPLSQLAFGLTYWALVYLKTGSDDKAIAAAIIAALAFNLGNEGGFPNAPRFTGIIPDIMNFLQLQYKLEPEIYREYRRHIFFLIKGMMIAVVPSLYMGSLAFFLLSAFSWPLAYWFGFHIAEQHRYDRGYWSVTFGTAFPEVLCGLAIGLSFWIVLP